MPSVHTFGTDTGHVSLTADAKEHDQAALRSVLEDPDSKAYRDLRDRAAYVYVTGSRPSHLRKFMSTCLRALSQTSVQPVALDGRAGSVEVRPEVVAALDLDNHAMVRRVREFINVGYRIYHHRDANARRPFSKVLIYRQDGRKAHQLVVQSDGSILDGWPK